MPGYKMLNDTEVAAFRVLRAGGWAPSPANPSGVVSLPQGAFDAKRRYGRDSEQRDVEETPLRESQEGRDTRRRRSARDADPAEQRTVEREPSRGARLNNAAVDQVMSRLKGKLSDKALDELETMLKGERGTDQGFPVEGEGGARRPDSRNRTPVESGLDENDDPDVWRVFLEFLRPRLREDDYAKVCEMLDAEPAPAEDEPPPFKGRPEPGGRMTAQDARRKMLAQDRAMREFRRNEKSFLAAYPMARHTKLLAADGSRRAPAVTGAARASFNQMFPEAGRLKVLG